MENIRFYKIVTIITIFTSVMTILSSLYIFVLPKYIINKFDLNMGRAASIGIIGGADGPTAIFVAGNLFSNVTSIAFFVISIIGIGYLFYSKKIMK